MSKHDKSEKNDPNRGWRWAAAVACEERRFTGESWGHGDSVAEILLARVHDPARLADALEGDIDGIDIRGPLPLGPDHWLALAEDLWHMLGLDLDLSRATPGRTLDVTPYHLWIETDPEAPHFHRRALDAPDPQLAADLLKTGRNLRSIVVVPGVPPTVIAGRGRTGAARLANRTSLDRIVSALAMSDAPLLMRAPRILGIADTRAGGVPLLTANNWDGEPEILGLLRIEVLDPDSELAAHAAHADNDHQRPETALSNARQVQALRDRGYRPTEIAAAKGVSSDTIANWTALLSLTAELQQLLEDGELSEAEGYRLGRITSDRQRAVYDASRGGKSVSERVALINRLAQGAQTALPAVLPVPKPPGRKQITRAVQRMRALPLAPAASAHAGARAVLRLLAGDAGALEGLEAAVAAEIRELLAEDKP